MNLNERISKVIEYSELSPSEFAELIEVQRSNISHITSGRNKPSLDFLIKIKEKFPDLDWDWLINGSGEMLIDKAAVSPSSLNATSLPDLFSLINDDDFGKAPSSKITPNETAPESNILNQDGEREKISDSQRLENPANEPRAEYRTANSEKIKRIVIFYENGKFESFEPK